MKLRYQKYSRLLKALPLFFLLCPKPSFAGFEIFAKGSATKNSISDDIYTVSVSASTGFAWSLLSWFQLEARYTNTTSLQNRLEVTASDSTFTLTDFKTQTSIYSLGMDIGFAGEKSIFQPFIFLGVGYIESERSYYYQTTSQPTATFHMEPRQSGISGTAGVGFRLRVLRSIAFEAEAFSYGLNVRKPDWGKNLQGNIGIRLYL